MKGRLYLTEMQAERALSTTRGCDNIAYRHDGPVAAAAVRGRAVSGKNPGKNQGKHRAKHRRQAAPRAVPVYTRAGLPNIQAQSAVVVDLERGQVEFHEVLGEPGTAVVLEPAEVVALPA